jgi:hypothetical protein
VQPTHGVRTGRSGEIKLSARNRFLVPAGSCQS